MPEANRPIVPDGMLRDKVLIVTGASQGIGRAAAFGFARAGASVVLAARRADLVEDHAAQIRAGGGAALAVGADVTDEDSQRQLVERAVDAYGRLDGAFNNAGIDQGPAMPHDLDLAEWRRVLAVKADGTFLGLKYQCPAILSTAGRGAIVNHGSVVGDRGIATLAAPCASQAAIVGLTKAATKAYGPEIRVNMLATGPIRTPERESMYPEEWPALPARRAGTPEECAAVAAWLLSDYSSYQYGAVVPVDGGQWA